MDSEAARHCVGTASEPDALDRFFTLSLDLMCIAGADGYFKRVNRAFDVLGHDPDELLARPFLDFVHPDDRDVVVAELAKLALGVPTVEVELRLRCRDGSYRWVAWTCTPDDTGALYAVGRDVTAKKQGEAALRVAAEEARRAGQFLDAIVENIPNMVFVKEAEQLAFARFNRAGEALLGVSRAALLGKTDFDFFPREEAEFFQAKDRETLRDGKLLDIPEEPIQTARGQRWLHTKKVPIVDVDGTPRFLLGISEDITERKQAAELRLRLAEIVESSEDAIIGLSLDRCITSWNGAAERILGYAAADVIGTSLALTPEGQSQEQEAIARLLQDEHVPHFETPQRRKDGEVINASVTISPIRDDAGAIIGFSKIARDISELKRVEAALRQSQAASEAANRELESFSYSVAHDLRAPLRAIDGFSQALLEDYGAVLDETGQRYLSFVRDAAQRMAELIDDLLSLSRVSRSQLRNEAVDLSALAAATIGRLRRDEPQRCVDVVIEDGLCVGGDPGLLGVMLDNLLGNAWKFTGRSASARIEVGRLADRSGPVYFVRDNGAGFDMAYAGKLFGVFQRLHTVAEFNGTGVGLATVQRIVARHGGRVWAEGAVGNGATFYFVLSEKESGS